MPSRPDVEEGTGREEELLGLLKTTQADFINYKRRVERDRQEEARFANADLILKLLPVLDDLERARKAMPPQVASTDWAGGIELIEKKLLSVLDSEGLSRIEAQGKEFDPWQHEAVSYDASDEYEEGQIKAVFKNGYRLNGRVIRPAQVAVANGMITEENEQRRETKWRRYWE